MNSPYLGSAWDNWLDRRHTILVTESGQCTMYKRRSLLEAKNQTVTDVSQSGEGANIQLRGGRSEKVIFFSEFSSHVFLSWFICYFLDK